MSKFTEKGMAKLKAIQEYYKSTPLTPVSKRRIAGGWAVKKQTVTVSPPTESAVQFDVFGNPMQKVSPRVQRIRDIQSGKRTAPLERRTMVWHDSPTKVSQNLVSGASQHDDESYDDWVKRMETAMDKAADYMESKS